MKKLYLTLISLIININIYALHRDSVYNELIRQEVPHANIVLKQAIHETGNFKSQLCKKHNNLFGLKGRKGYRKYSSYKECIADYKRLISSRYKGGDYYAFLVRIGYAADKQYISKLKKI